MKIAFFWTWEFSTNILKWILNYNKINKWELENEIEVKVVVSQPDKPIWRKKVLTQTTIKTFAIENNIKVLQPEKFKNNIDFFKELNSLNLDFIIVVAYWKIVPKEVLNTPKYWCINIHWSILPFYRWASPIQESIKNWDKETWLTIMYMSEWMDEWDILEMEKINIDKLDKTEDIFKKFELIGSKLLINTLEKILKWSIKWTRQNEAIATYCSKISKEDWKIDFQNNSWNEIYNKFRAYSIWPWIYTYFEWKKLGIEDCELMDYYWNELIWKVVKIDKKTIWIVCNNKKILILKQVKLEWKKSIDILSFVNWNKRFLEYNF